MSSMDATNVNHSEWGGGGDYFLLGECKCSINVAFPLQRRQLVSALLTSVSSVLIAKEKQQRPFQTRMDIKAWLSSRDFLLIQSNHRRISFHLVLPCTAKHQVSTCPQVPRLHVNMPVCVKIGFNLNLKIFSAFAFYITKRFNSGLLPKVKTA